MIIQPIINIAEICSRHDITQTIICPGSRNAPLTLAFARHPKIKTYVIPDERSAGFIALGLAQSSNKPVVLICTSGTAVANLYPSIIEAFYQQVPLLILTADRPQEWIDQHDGQTIRQENIFRNHILRSFQFPVSFDHEDGIWHSEKMVSEAIIIASENPKGPVHINVPIREPFYPSPEEEYHYNANLKIIRSSEPENILDDAWAGRLIQELTTYKRILVAVGQTRLSHALADRLNTIQKKLKWVVLGDITANVNNLDHSVTKHDLILKDFGNIEKYKPDLLITFGNSVLSKNLKNYLRLETINAHWNIGIENDVIDSFKSLTMLVKVNADFFFELVEKQITEKKNSQISYFNQWTKKELQAQEFVKEFFKTESASEFYSVYRILSEIPQNSIVHLANSMPVRYANLIGLKKDQEITVYSNRGTSGIDGCVSTSIGHAINSGKLNILITGDVAFFYDRNALWHNHLPKNIRIVLLNNHGGGIFRLINGPKQLDELEDYFEARQKLNAANTARDFGLNYFTIKSMEALPDLLTKFFDPKTGPAILEIETNPKTNQQVFEEFNHKAILLWK